MLEDFPDILIVDDIMELLNVSKNTAYRLMRKGILPAFRLGKLWRVNKSDFIDFCKKHELDNNF